MWWTDPLALRQEQPRSMLLSTSLPTLRVHLSPDMAAWPRGAVRCPSGTGGTLACGEGSRRAGPCWVCIAASLLAHTQALCTGVANKLFLPGLAPRGRTPFCLTASGPGASWGTQCGAAWPWGCGTGRCPMVFQQGPALPLQHIP